MDNVYNRLRITATDPSTKIWVGDDEGFLVVAEVGVLDARILTGDYVVSFGLHGVRHPIHLDRDTITTEEVLTS